ncbi:MAG: RNA polymerase factor sigma-54 [Proteobacteria bacterium]|nr:RNA polymerase factor sigma-54 [Pseudomonadota bacterium]
MKPTLSPQLGQHLALTPALRQAIHLLGLSATELEDEVNLALESNPLLERADDADVGATVTPATPTGDTAPTQDTVADPGADASDTSVESSEWDAADYASPHDHSPGGRGEDDGTFEQPAAPDTLLDHLLWQLHLTPMTPRERAIGVALIEAVGEDGYLTESPESIRAGLLPEIDACSEEVTAVLHRIQRFDPIGVACTRLSECLAVQLSMLAPDTPGLALARQVADGHLDTLAKAGPERLASRLGADPAVVHEAVALLRSLDPRPGGRMASAAPEYVQPDCVAYRQCGAWHVALAGNRMPALAISRHYEALLSTASGTDAAYLRGRLQEARWLLKSLQTRADTVLRVARAIVRQQTGFLDYGPEAMRPLTLREVADELGLHESTISRATTRKYLHTPRGTFEFKHFFSSGIANADGEAASSTAIQAMIRRLVEAEDARRPLSDARLADDLNAAGIPVARRTVAKYREILRIAPSHERQRPS